MARRKAYLHIGLPGSDTTFVPTALSAHAEGLARTGLTVPAVSCEESLRAALEIRRDHKAWGFKRAEVEGTWAEICRRALKSRTDVVISQELLAGASGDQAALVLDGLAGCEVHLVLTLRDPGTQVTSAWEGSIKAGRSVSFARFRERIMDPERTHEHAQQFWAGQHVGEVLDRWAAQVRPSRVHIISVPPGNDTQQDVWRTFGEVVGFDADEFPLPVRRAAQPRLGTTEVAVLREVNLAIDGRIKGRIQRTVVQRYFAERVLPAGDSVRPAMPADTHDELVRLAEGWTKKIANAGYAVHGSLDDLLPLRTEHPSPALDEVTDEDRLRTTTDALANVLVEVARLREHNEQLEVRNVKLERKRKKLKRLKRKLAEAEAQ